MYIITVLYRFKIIFAFFLNFFLIYISFSLNMVKAPHILLWDGGVTARYLV